MVKPLALVSTVAPPIMVVFSPALVPVAAGAVELVPVTATSRSTSAAIVSAAMITAAALATEAGIRAGNLAWPAAAPLAGTAPFTEAAAAISPHRGARWCWQGRMKGNGSTAKAACSIDAATMPADVDAAEPEQAIRTDQEVTAEGMGEGDARLPAAVFQLVRL